MNAPLPIPALAWPLTLLALVHMAGWARVALLGERGWLLFALTTLGLSAGSLSLVGLWCGLLGLPIDWRLTTLICGIIGSAGLVAARRVGGHIGPSLHNAGGPDIEYPQLTAFGTWLARATLAAVCAFVVLIVFSAVYWPFRYDDSISIYAMFGKRIAQTGKLPPLVPGSLYEAYPMLIPLVYAYTHQAAGWIDEHLAALLPALLSVSVFGVTYLLAWENYGASYDSKMTSPSRRHRFALLAVALCMFMPAVVFWAGASYADLPCAFFFCFAVYFYQLDRSNSLEHPARRYFFLSGVMAGLAAWTKNSALLIILGFGILFLRNLLITTYPNPKKGFRNVRPFLLVAVGFSIVAGPWYLRNFIQAGVIVPATGWTFAAQRLLTNVMPFAIDARYLPIGIVLSLAPGYLYFRAFRAFHGSKLRSLLIFYVPFFAIWWALFSYENRFLLVVLPLAAVMGAWLVCDVYYALANRFGRQVVRLVASAALIATFIYTLPNTVDNKIELLRAPFMSEDAKHRVRLGDHYPVSLFLQTLPAGSLIYTFDYLLEYHTDSLTFLYTNPPQITPAGRAIYSVVRPGDALPTTAQLPPLFEVGGYRVVALR